MAVEKITQRTVDLPAQQTGDSITVNSANSFNNKFINPFEKPSLTQPTAAQTRYSSAPSKGLLFGDKLVGQDNEGYISEKSELPESSTSGLSAISNFWKSKSAQFKNFFGNIGSNVNEYDAAVNSALKYLPSPLDLEAAAESIPSIRAILKKENLPVKMNYNNLKTIKHTHLSTTIEFSRAIGKEMGMSENELKTMEAGAALHDIGKSLVPEEILNKNGRLTPEERKVINLHSVLGYELLKGLGFGTNVAEIARDHHNPNSKNKMAQIVRAADVYSAMREERPYKTAKTHDEAMAVLKDMNIKPEILNALDKNYAPKKTPEITVPYRTQTSAA
ncbi:MAG: HD domain-containing protein [Clostridium sp.]|nr:HD domain-containing protein [Clostridium sp.]